MIIPELEFILFIEVISIKPAWFVVVIEYSHSRQAIYPLLVK